LEIKAAVAINWNGSSYENRKRTTFTAKVCNVAGYGDFLLGFDDDTFSLVTDE
jgi:hypothetical protein